MMKERGRREREGERKERGRREEGEREERGRRDGGERKERGEERSDRAPRSRVLGGCSAPPAHNQSSCSARRCAP
jgi:hypothetical protein